MNERQATEAAMAYLAEPHRESGDFLIEAWPAILSSFITVLVTSRNKEVIFRSSAHSGQEKKCAAKSSCDAAGISPSRYLSTAWLLTAPSWSILTPAFILDGDTQNLNVSLIVGHLLCRRVLIG